MLEDDRYSDISSTAYCAVVHGVGLGRRKEGQDASAFFRFTTTFRKLSFCLLFFVNLSWLLLTIILALNGLNPINTDNIGEVGLIIPQDEYMQRHNAYYVAKDEADLALTVAKCKREEPANPIKLILMKGDFEDANKGNALTQDGLEALKEHEDRILSETGWSDGRCALVYSETYPDCAIAFDLEVPNGYGGRSTVSTKDGCLRPYSPTYLFEKYGDPKFLNISRTVARIREAGVDWLSFQDMLHKDFTEESLESKILVSKVYAGIPRKDVEDYVNEEDLRRIQEGFSISYYSDSEKEEEVAHLGHWIGKHLVPYFERRFDDKPFRLLYNYDQYDPIGDQVLTDLSLLAISILFVIIYMTFYTGSIFLTACAIFQIFMSFAGANLLYRYCWPNAYGLGYDYFTLFCALALFIIIGIGADDIFVYYDTWSGSATYDYKSIAHRMSHVWSHAAVAMGITSLTTVICFLSNLASPFIGIQTFGIFSALLVIVNYFAVITFFPVVVLVYQRYFSTMQYFWTPCFRRFCWPMAASSWNGIYGRWRPTEASFHDSDDNMDATTAATSFSEEGDDSNLDQSRSTARETQCNTPRMKDTAGRDYESKLPIWFRDVYAPFLLRRRYSIVGTLIVVWIIFLAFATMLEAQAFRVYELLPSTENFHQVTFISEKWLPRTATPLQVHVLYGLDHRAPLNLHGQKPQNFEFTTSGTPEWDTSFDLDSIAAQMQLYRTAEEFAFTPREGLKIDNTNGINPQLKGSDTGSLEDTLDGGSSSGVQAAYGIQSFIHALATWENVSIPVGTSGHYIYRKRATSCRACFDHFKIEPNPFDEVLEALIDPETGLVVSTLTLNASTLLNDGCNCYGYFPIASSVCLYETIANTADTLFKCAGGEDNVATQVSNFLRAGDTGHDEEWWSKYIFAIADSYGRYVRVALYDIQCMTTLKATDADYTRGLRVAKEWDSWMDDHNSDDGNPLRVMVYVENSEQWIVDSLLLPSGIQNMVLSLFLCWFILVLSTGNILTASIATITIGQICTCVLGFIQIVGWGLGAIESVCIVIVVGFSIDYTVHLADSYMSSKSLTRQGKTLDALVHSGSSVLSGAISTLGASFPMIFAQIIFFQKFGIFVAVTIAFSLIYSLGFFAAILPICGPLGRTGDLSFFYGGFVEAMHKNMMELEEEEKLLRLARKPRKDSSALLLSSIKEEKGVTEEKGAEAADDRFYKYDDPPPPDNPEGYEEDLCSTVYSGADTRSSHQSRLFL